MTPAWTPQVERRGGGVSGWGLAVWCLLCRSPGGRVVELLPKHSPPRTQGAQDPQVFYHFLNLDSFPRMTAALTHKSGPDFLPQPGGESGVHLCH